MKYSINHIFALTFWCAITLASISVVRSTGTNDRIVGNLITSSFSLITVGFVFFAAFSAFYGRKLARPFWMGVASVCCLLLFVAPTYDLGLNDICLSVARSAIKNKQNAADVVSNFALNLSQSESAKASNMAEIMRLSLIPALGLVGGILAQSIAIEGRKSSENVDSDREPTSNDGSAT